MLLESCCNKDIDANNDWIDVNTNKITKSYKFNIDKVTHRAKEKKMTTKSKKKNKANKQLHHHCCHTHFVTPLPPLRYEYIFIYTSFFPVSLLYTSLPFQHIYTYIYIYAYIYTSCVYYHCEPQKLQKIVKKITNKEISEKRRQNFFLFLLCHRLKNEQQQQQNKTKHTESWVNNKLMPHVRIFFLWFSFCLLFSNRGWWWRWANIQRESLGSHYEDHRLPVRVGLLLGLAQDTELGCVRSVRSVRRAIHYAVYRCKYTVHGIGSSWYG